MISRKPRFTPPGIAQQVIQRDHHREPCFYGEIDYRRYLGNLREAAEKNEATVHAYVLMINHVHLLVTPGTAHSIEFGAVRADIIGRPREHQDIHHYLTASHASRRSSSP